MVTAARFSGALRQCEMPNHRFSTEHGRHEYNIIFHRHVGRTTIQRIHAMATTRTATGLLCNKNTKINEMRQERIQVRFCGETTLSAKHEKLVSNSAPAACGTAHDPIAPPESTHVLTEANPSFAGTTTLRLRCVTIPDTLPRDDGGKGIGPTSGEWPYFCEVHNIVLRPVFEWVQSVVHPM